MHRGLNDLTDFSVKEANTLCVMATFPFHRDCRICGGRRESKMKYGVTLALLKIYFIDYANTVVPIFPLYLLHAVPQFPPALPLLSSRPWVTHVTSLATPLPTLSLTSSCLFCTYQFVLLNPCTYPLLFPLPPPN